MATLTLCPSMPNLTSYVVFFVCLLYIPVNERLGLIARCVTSNLYGVKLPFEDGLLRNYHPKAQGRDQHFCSLIKKGGSFIIFLSFYCIWLAVKFLAEIGFCMEKSMIKFQLNKLNKNPFIYLLLIRFFPIGSQVSIHSFYLLNDLYDIKSVRKIKVREAASLKQLNQLLQGNGTSRPVSPDTLCYINMLCNTLMIVQKFNRFVKFFFNKDYDRT